jgi:putative ABC transport system substrate-binding protein
MRLIGLAVVLALSLGSALLAAQAQPTKVYKVGILSLGFRDPTQPDWWGPFTAALHELNYVEGRNLLLKRGVAAGRPELLSGLADELVHAEVDVIVTTSVRETRAAMRATSTIPIVMTLVADPVSQGLVKSLARPGGNVTGLTNLVPGLTQKYVELLREMLPSARRFGVITSSLSLRSENRRELETAANALGVTLSFISVPDPLKFDAALVRATKAGITGIIAPADPVTFLHRTELARLLLKHRLPAIFWTREYVEAGGLMTYSVNHANQLRHAAIFVDKLLKGSRPADLPVEQPTKFELVINLNTAKVFGLTIPQTLLLRADQVLE